MNFTCFEKGNKVKNLTRIGPFIETFFPKGANCDLQLYHARKEDLDRRVFLQDKVRATILVAKEDFVEKKFKSFHEKGLEACPTN